MVTAPLSDLPKHVFVIQHVHEFKEGGEDVKFIGVFSSRKTAEDAVAKLICVSGFKDTPDGFVIEEYELDKSHWLDGFITV